MGFGGFSLGVVNLNSGQTLSIYVGGQGQLLSTGSAGGFNGGGASQTIISRQINFRGSGGGATDIRLGGENLANRIIVAGGGGAGAGGPGGGGGSGYIGGVSSGLGFTAQNIAGDTSITSPTGEIEIGHHGNGFARITLLEIRWAY